MRYFVFLLFSLILLAACSEDNYQGTEDNCLTVEGWIETGEFPTVIVTRAIPLSSSATTSLDDCVAYWAKVSVSDGDTTEILTGIKDTRYYPSFVYRGMSLRGKTGRSYRLTVEDGNDTLTAVTILPPPQSLDSIQVIQCSPTDTLFTLRAYATTPPDTSTHYQFFTQVLPEERRHFASFMGTFDGSSFGKNINGVEVLRGRHDTKLHTFTPYYGPKAIVSVRLARISEEEAHFWTTYESIISLQGNLLFPIWENLPTNVTGGHGWWSGFGSTHYRVNIATGEWEKL